MHRDLVSGVRHGLTVRPEGDYPPAVKGGDKLDHWGTVMVYHLVLSVIGDVHANGSRKRSSLATVEAVRSRRKPEVTGVG